MNGRFTSSSKLISVPGKKTQGNPLQQFNTHDPFGISISFSVNWHNMANAEYLSRGWIGYPKVNTTSLYLDKIISALNCSTDPC